MSRTVSMMFRRSRVHSREKIDEAIKEFIAAQPETNVEPDQIVGIDEALLWDDGEVEVTFRVKSRSGR